MQRLQFQAVILAMLLLAGCVPMPGGEPAASTARPTATALATGSPSPSFTGPNDYEYAATVEAADPIKKLTYVEFSEALGNLQMALVTHEGETFGGLYATPFTMQATVSFTHDGEATLARYVKGQPIADYITLRTVDYPLELLVSTMGDYLQIVIDLGFEATGGTDVHINRAVINVLSVDDVEAALAEAGIVLPDQIVLQQVDDMPREE